MERLINLSDRLTGQYDAHTDLLQQANNMTDEILDKLGDTAASAATLSDEFQRRGSPESWWPYIWCPVASIVMGSYGLPPSLLRNIGLLLLGKVFSPSIYEADDLHHVGETAGFIISSFSSLSSDSIGWKTLFTTVHLRTDNNHNITTLASELELR